MFYGYSGLCGADLVPPTLSRVKMTLVSLYGLVCSLLGVTCFKGVFFISHVEGGFRQSWITHSQILKLATHPKH